MKKLAISTTGSNKKKKKVEFQASITKPVLLDFRNQLKILLERILVLRQLHFNDQEEENVCFNKSTAPKYVLQHFRKFVWKIPDENKKEIDAFKRHAMI